MLLQTDGVAEGFSADVAAKRSGSTVGPPDVDLQSVGRGEHLRDRGETALDYSDRLTQPQ